MDDRITPASDAPLELERVAPISGSRFLGRRFRRIIGATAACAILVLISVLLIDRPLATWVHQNLGDTRFNWFTAPYEGHWLIIGPFSLMASPAQALGTVAVFVLTGLIIATVMGWRAKMRGRIFLTLAVSVIAAKEINAITKFVFGRTWPESWLGNNPSWIRDGVYGFFPLHGGSGWGSFPSGHTTVITAPAIILWTVWPELRPVWATIVAVVTAGLVGANYHFLSDIIGGLFLGTAIGFGIRALMLSPNDRLTWSSLRRSALSGTAARPQARLP